MKKGDNSFKKLDRKTVEKNRRIRMKGLCYKLNSLIPSSFHQPYKLFTQEDWFDQSTAYIEHLRKKIEAMKKKRDEVNNGNINDASGNDCQGVASQSTIDVKELDGRLQVFLTTKLQQKFSFSEIVSILEDGGAEMVKGGYTTVGDRVIYTLHAQARVTRIGVDVTGVRKQLQALINRSYREKGSTKPVSDLH